MNLTRMGYEVRTAPNGRVGLALLESFSPDLVVLDVLMPEVGGTEFAQRVRSMPQHRTLPIIMLTALTEESDEIRGLTAGADDYMTKPFSVKVLEARIAALLRRSRALEGQSERSGERGGERLRSGPIEMDLGTHEAFVSGEDMHLTVTEFRLLAALLQGAGRVLSRKALIEAAMGPGVTVTERTIDVHVTSLRKKVGESNAGMIKTVRGVGYRVTNGRHEAD